MGPLGYQDISSILACPCNAGRVPGMRPFCAETGLGRSPKPIEAHRGLKFAGLSTPAPVCVTQPPIAARGAALSRSTVRRDPIAIGIFFDVPMPSAIWRGDFAHLSETSGAIGRLPAVAGRSFLSAGHDSRPEAASNERLGASGGSHDVDGLHIAMFRVSGYWKGIDHPALRPSLAPCLPRTRSSTRR
jgi:hypothetical protein